MEKRRVPSATSALLQKASSQLKGERVVKPEDELNAYISSLTQKTSQQKKSVNFEDSSISISSDVDVDEVPKPAPIVTSGSKFLKKNQQNPEDETPLTPAGNKFLKKPATSVSPAPSKTPQPRYGTSLSGSGQGSRPVSQAGVGRLAQSSALNKATALTGKLQQKAATRKSFNIESDSDESLAAVMKMTKGVTSLSLSEQVSESSESVKIGRDAGKFLKKASPAMPAVQKSVEPPVTTVTHKDKNKATTVVKQQPLKKASPFTLKSSLKYSTDVVLTSEEESLAEFVGALPSSSGDSFEKPKKKPIKGKGRLTPSPPPLRAQSPTPYGKPSGRETRRGQSRSKSPQSKPPVIRRTPSPSPRASNQSPNLRRRTPSPKLIRSYSDDSNVAESIQSEIAEDFDIGVNTLSKGISSPKKHVVIMDLEDLGAAGVEDTLPPPETPTHSDMDSPFRASARKDAREDKKKGKDKKVKVKETAKDSGKDPSPFRAVTGRQGSPFKANKNTEEDVSPFKAKSKGSVLKASQVSDSPFKAGNKENKSPFKAGSKENQSPFSAKTKGNDSPFLAKSGNSPFKASNEGSVFKSSKKGSPFKAGSRSPSPDKDRSSPSFKAKRSAGKRTKKNQDKKATKKKSKTKDKPTDIFSTFGLQTIDDLLGASARETESGVTVTEVDDDDDEVRSEVSEEIRTEKPGMYSYSQQFENSATEIISEVVEGTKYSAAPSYTEEFDSISEKIGQISDRGRSSGSDIVTKCSDDETVLDESDYTDTESDYSRSRSNSMTRSRTITRSRGRTERSDSEDESTYTEDYEDYSKSLVPTSRSDMTPRPKRGMATAGVQTPADGIQYGWNPMGSGLSFAGTPYGLHFVDPTPIATHVVSADALEAMTAYSPAMLALQDMLKSQYDLTREFLETQKRLHDDFTRNIESTFHYTTLKDTKRYIRKNKKKKLTFKEALQLVDLEMAGH